MSKKKLHSADDEEIKGLIELYQNKKYLELEKKVLKIINDDEENFIVFNILGLVKSSQNKTDEAIKNFDKALSIKKDYVAAHNNKGNLLLKDKKFSEAIISYKKAIKYEKNSEQIQFNLSNCYLENKQYNQAIEVLEVIIKNNKEFTQAYQSLGVAYSFENEYEKSNDAFYKILKTDNNNIDAIIGIGNNFFKNKEFEEANNFFNEKIKKKIKNERVYYNNGYAYQQRAEYDLAIEEYNKAITLSPKFFDCYVNLSLCFKGLSRDDDCIINLEKALGIRKDNKSVLKNLGNLYLSNGDYNQAIKYYKKFENLDKLDIDILLCLSISFFRLNQLEHSINYIHKVLKINKNSTEALNLLGEISYIQGDYKKTIKELEKSLSIEDIDNTEKSYFYLGLSYEKIKDYKKSLLNFEESLYDDGINYWKENFLKVLYKMGDNKKFNNTLEELIDENRKSSILQSIVNHAKINLKIESNYEFCNNAIELIYKKSIKDSFKKISLNIEDYANNFFNNEDTEVKLIKESISKCLINYKKSYQSKNVGYFKDLDDEITTILKPFMISDSFFEREEITNDYLSGIVFLSESNDTFEIDFKISGDNYPDNDEHYPNKVIKIKDGDLIFFPSSLFYKLKLHNDAKASLIEIKIKKD